MRNNVSHFSGLFLLIGLLAAALLGGDYFPVSFKTGCYTISLAIKTLLIFILPFLIFGFVFSSMVGFGKQGVKFLLLLIPLICLSSFLSTSLAYLVGKPIIMKGISLATVTLSYDNLHPFWHFTLPKIVSNDIALFLGFLSGITAAYMIPQKAHFFSQRLMTFNMLILRKVFMPLMPLFIFGFALKLQHEKVLELIFTNYLKVFVVISLMLFTYIVGMYGVMKGFNVAAWSRALRNMLPAGLAGFSTMSSAASLPLTLDGAEKNSHVPKITRSVIPSTLNIHLVGDCFATPILALAILISFGKPLPDVTTYLIFSLYFILAKFAVAAVPGGGILVMLPVLEQWLGFTPEMLSLITALYIVFDPFITAANVMGNGGFALFFERVFHLLKANALPPYKAV